MLAGVSRQSYYKHKKANRARQKMVAKVVELIHSVRCVLPRLGGRKLYHLLREELQQLKVGRDKLFSIMRSNNLLIKPKRSYHKTTHSHHRFRKHKNQVKDMEIKRPEQVFVSDITYLGTRSNPLYLALVTDLYSKKVMGHDLSTSLAASGAVNALKKAIKTRVYPEKDLMHHSDRGLQYCGDDYQTLLKKAKIKCSMTEQYDPYENAVAERINGILKQELLPTNKQLAQLDFSVALQLVNQAIRIYNQYRPHWSCWMNTPEVMHQQQLLKRRVYTKTGAFSSEKTPT